AIKENEARYRQLYENANDIIYVHDLEGNYLSVNGVAERVLGYTLEEALQLNINDIAVPEHLARARENLALKLTSEPEQTDYELEIISKSGERVTLELSTRLIVSPDGIPQGVQGLGRDITARRQAEASLLETLSLFATTFESTADGIVVMSLDREIVTANQKFI